VKTEKQSQKRLSIKPKHAKPYRKRHFMVLAIMVLLAFGLFGLVISIAVRIEAGRADNARFIDSTFAKTPSTEMTVSSSYGFGFKYDPRRLYASAIDGSSGRLYIGVELATLRPYQTIKLSTRFAPGAAIDQETVSLDYYATDAANQTLAAVERNHIALAQNNVTPSVDQTESVMLNNITFQKTSWKVLPAGELGSKLTSHFTSYTAIVNGKPMIIRTSAQIGSRASTNDLESIVRSLKLGEVTASITTPSAHVAAAVAKNRSLLDSILFSQANAANALDSQTISALYAPAVVKIYNAYCTDISIKGQPYLANACAGSSGSGFFVSSNGLIATNGHVATANPKDIVIQNAYTTASAGDGQQLVKLAVAAGLDINQLATIHDNEALLDTIFNAVYAMPDSDFTESNDVHNLLVGLDSKDPDLTQLLSLTNARKQYAPNDDLKAATLVAADYRQYDGITKYRNSDVALIKISGANYPVVKLGSLGDVSQGSTISILGYPVAASNNPIVAKDISAVTLTSGKVSAIKTANGDSRQLIETDTTIGHGNSGGPVFADNGKVVGIATYTIDGSGTGDGTFNYIRDIADLQALIATSSIRLSSSGATQTTWQQAIAAFDSAHYSKSLKLFANVRKLYPEHPTIDSFVNRAEQNVSDGKNARDLPLGLLIGGAVAAVIVASVVILLIIRHHAKHQVFKLASGQATAVPADLARHPRGGYYYPVAPKLVDEAAVATPAQHPHNG
jgi:S1-C subfamily serine protease